MVQSAQKTEVPENGQYPQALHEAFERFTEASTKLEARYAALVQETEILRKQLHEKDLKIKRAEKLAVLGETAAALAHEVRNPLGAMRLFVSLLKQDLADRPESLRLAEQVDQNISSLDHVVSNILHFSRSGAIQRVPVNIESVVREQAESFKLLHPQMGSFDVSFEGSTFVRGDEHALRRVFSNLLLNALQATRYKGMVKVRGRSNEKGEMLLVVEDNGPGIPPAMLDKIFEPFVTSKNEGTGLGLAIVRQIIEDHGGEISVSNIPGARFEIRLPR